MNPEILVVEDSPTQAAAAAVPAASRPATRSAPPATASPRSSSRASSRPALVVTDVVMPRMDGYALCRAIKADPKLQRLPVILLTSLSSPQDVIEGLACGADNFVRKPYEGASLLARVERCLADGAERGRVRRSPPRMGAEREQVLDFLFSTFEETVHLDGELTRSYHSLDLLYRVAEGLNRCTTEREVVLEVLARALELPGVPGAWIEIEGDRRSAGGHVRADAVAGGRRRRRTSRSRCAPGPASSGASSSSAPTSACSTTTSCARSTGSAPRSARRSIARCCRSTSNGACRSARRSSRPRSRRAAGRRRRCARWRRSSSPPTTAWSGSARTGGSRPGTAAPPACTATSATRRSGSSIELVARPDQRRRDARDAQPGRLGRVDPGPRDGPADPRRARDRGQPDALAGPRRRRRRGRDRRDRARHQRRARSSSARCCSPRSSSRSAGSRAASRTTSTTC